MGLAKYYPELTEEDMAFLCGVSKPAIRRYISEHSIDPNFDKTLIKYRNIREYLLDEKHRDETDKEISDALTAKYGGGYSRGTVYALRKELYIKMYEAIRKYREEHSKATDSEVAEVVESQLKRKCDAGMVEKLWTNPPTRPAKGKISVVDLSFSPQMLPRVSDDEGNILRLIRKVWLKRVPQFECDLTYGKGDFYRMGERAPEKWKFDKYPDVDSGVLPLDKASSMIPNDSLMSVVIDLPQAISEDGNGNSAAFSSEEDMVLSYYNLIKIAYDKLKQSFDKSQGGILIVKTGDFDYKDERLWVHHFVIDLVTGGKTGVTKRFFDILEKYGITPEFKMLLVDKAIHTFTPHEKEQDASGKRSKQAHDYFLIFQRTKVNEEPLYVKSEDRHKTFGALHVSENERKDYRKHLIYGTLRKKKLPLADRGSHDSRKYTREIIKEASPDDIIDAYKRLPIEQLKRIEEYEGFPGGRIPAIPSALTGGQMIDFLCGEIGSFFAHEDGNSEIKKLTADVKKLRSIKVCRHVSDALFRCGFVYIDFGKEGRLYLEGLEHEEA